MSNIKIERLTKENNIELKDNKDKINKINNLLSNQEKKLNEIYNTINELEKTKFTPQVTVHMQDQFATLLHLALLLLAGAIVLEKLFLIRIP